MVVSWHNPDAHYDSLILAGDVGGTNTNLAIVGESNGVFTIILEVVFPSAEINGLEEPLQKVLQIAQERSRDLNPGICCISAAGAVQNNVCRMTNCSWSVDGGRIGNLLGIETIVINDFSAIGYGIPALDIANPEQITPLKHPDGSLPPRIDATIAVIGPGTGLGVSVLIPYQGNYITVPSEGGHMAFAPIDEESEALCMYMKKKIDAVPGVELFVSGQGVRNIFNFYRDVKKVPMQGLLAEINEKPDSQKPASISRGANENEICHAIMQLYVRLFASAASNLSCLTLPFGGLYLAGGTPAKDLKWLQENDLFMSTFEKNYNPSIVPLLKRVPVYVIRDYSISLYGAARAGLLLQSK